MTVRQGITVEGGVDTDAVCSFAADHGFTFVELNMEGQFHRSRVDPDAIRETAERYGLDIVVHLPYALDPGSPHDGVRDGACRELEAAIDTAAAMGAERAVFHATTSARQYHWEQDAVRETIVDAVERVSTYGRKRGVDAVAENLKSPFFDAGDFGTLFERTDANACLDTGHAFVSGQRADEQAQLLREHGNRITHIHLNETRREDEDEHLPVGLGRVDFGTLAEAIAETGWEGTCTHEVFRVGDGGREYVAASKRTFDDLLA